MRTTTQGLTLPLPVPPGQPNGTPAQTLATRVRMAAEQIIRRIGALRPGAPVRIQATGDWCGRVGVLIQEPAEDGHVVVRIVTSKAHPDGTLLPFYAWDVEPLDV